VSSVIKASDFEQCRKTAATDRRALRAARMSFADLRRQADRVLASAHTQAAEILDAARAEAQRQAAEALEAARRAGHEQGVPEGREAGRAEAFEDAQARFAEQHGSLVAALSGALEQLDADRRALMVSAQRELIELALAIAERVVKAHVACDAEAVRANLAEAIELAGHRRDVTVRVHPDDCATAEQFAAGLGRPEAPRGHVTVTADAAVARGGCVVTTDHGEIDARLETQLARIAEALLPTTAAADDEAQTGGRDA